MHITSELPGLLPEVVSSNVTIVIINIKGDSDRTAKCQELDSNEAPEMQSQEQVMQLKKRRWRFIVSLISGINTCS